jgi:hypothetical protein
LGIVKVEIENKMLRVVFETKEAKL